LAAAVGLAAVILTAIAGGPDTTIAHRSLSPTAGARYARRACDDADVTEDGSPRAAEAFGAVDVHYLGADGARAALVAAPDPLFSSVIWSKTAMSPAAAPYRPAEFWRRELPPVRAVCQGVAGLALIVVDGYVDLSPTGQPGLGAHVHAEFGVPVIGVAKTFFRTAVHAAQVRRGRSARPLFVTAIGIERRDAARFVAQMTGQYRIPDALRLADRLARGLEYPTLSAATSGAVTAGVPRTKEP
jgi:deoxyribonuclease V